MEKREYTIKVTDEDLVHVLDALDQAVTGLITQGGMSVAGAVMSVYDQLMVQRQNVVDFDVEQYG